MGKIQKALEIIFNDRKELGKTTQSDLARATGYSRTYIHNLLCGGKRFNEDSIIKICDALGITLSDVERVIARGKSGLSSTVAWHRQNRQNVNAKYAPYHDLLNIILYATRTNAKDFRRGIEMTLISYATAIMAKEDANGPNYELLQNALKAIERKERASVAPDLPV
jgi:transcriptional regulator with XRE-family HTH domain